MKESKYIEVCCYGRIELWENRRMAINFYRCGADCCEGCERERYTNVLMDLLDGKRVCVDEHYEAEKIAEYNRCRVENRYLYFDNPHNTRDYGGRMYEINEKKSFH